MSERTSEAEEYAISCLESASVLFDGPVPPGDSREGEALLAGAAYLAAIHEELKRGNDRFDRFCTEVVGVLAAIKAEPAVCNSLGECILVPGHGGFHRDKQGRGWQGNYPQLCSHRFCVLEPNHDGKHQANNGMEVE